MGVAGGEGRAGQGWWTGGGAGAGCLECPPLFTCVRIPVAFVCPLRSWVRLCTRVGRTEGAATAGLSLSTLSKLVCAGFVDNPATGFKPPLEESGAPGKAAGKAAPAAPAAPAKGAAGTCVPCQS